MERFRDRDWIPDDGEIDSLADLRDTDQGQVLLRLIDREMHDSLVAVLARKKNVSDITYEQGMYAAYLVVKSWLTKERDDESQEEESES